MWSWLAATSASQVQVILLPQPPEFIVYRHFTGTHCHIQLIFVFLVETGFHHVDQDGLDFLTSWSTRLGLPKCWDYMLKPPRPAKRPFLKIASLSLFSFLLLFKLLWYSEEDGSYSDPTLTYFYSEQLGSQRIYPMRNAVINKPLTEEKTLLVNREKN